MRRSISVRATLAAVLLTAAAATVGADCISTTRTVSQPLVFPSHAAGPVAWTGAIYGVAKMDEPTNVAYFATYDADLNQLTADRIVSNTSIANGPLALLWNGSEFALFYQTDALQLVFQRIAVSGAPIGSPIPVVPQHLNWQNQEYDIAWDATRKAYVIFHTIPTGPERGLWLTVVDREGKTLLDSLMSIYFSTRAQPRLAVTPKGELGLVWLRIDDGTESLYFMLVNAANDVTAVESVSTVGIDPVIATNGSQFLIVTRRDITASNTSELRAVRVDTKGAIVAADAPFLPARGVDIVPVSLTWNPTLAEWALVYSESVPGFAFFPGETRLRRFNFATPASDVSFSPDPTKSIFAMRYPLVWSGTSYVGSIARTVSRIEGSDTHLVRQCPLIATVTAPRDTPLYSQTQFTGTASGGIPSYSYSWDFGDTEKADGPTPRHQYVRTGTYTVTLTVRDTSGSVATTTWTVNVVVPKRRAARH